ncbi:MAG TPA: hypothetical protein VGR62_12425 [Candidatus Binatia bacterium]|jgi:hypothetical protein|nr:hypothetical protein [Candidatus Binatia bacterium]
MSESTATASIEVVIADRVDAGARPGAITIPLASIESVEELAPEGTHSLIVLKDGDEAAEPWVLRRDWREAAARELISSDRVWRVAIAMNLAKRHGTFISRADTEKSLAILQDDVKASSSPEIEECLKRLSRMPWHDPRT